MEENSNSIIVKTINSEKIVLFGFIKNSRVFIFDTSVQNGYREASDIEIKNHYVVPKFDSSKSKIFDILTWFKANIILHNLELDLQQLIDIDESDMALNLEKIRRDYYINEKNNNKLQSNIHEESSLILKLVKDDIRWYFPETWTKDWILEKLTNMNSESDWI